jgi:CheY-like chemotaxis protein
MVTNLQLTPGYHLLLADDDFDDCTFFKEAMEELSLSTTLTIVNDGVELMHYLRGGDQTPPDLIFLDLNMPRKTGLECLVEIKTIDKLRRLPVIIFSTSLEMDVVESLYEKGAHYYIRKPAEFSSLKKVIHEALAIIGRNSIRPPKERFVIKME